MEAYAKANLFEKEMEEIGRANKMMQTGKGVTGVLGLANDYFGMDSAKNSLIDSGNEIRLIETDIENIYQLLNTGVRTTPATAIASAASTRCMPSLKPPRNTRNTLLPKMTTTIRML